MRVLMRSVVVVFSLSTAALAGDDFVLRPGVVVDPGRQVAYMMRAGGGIDALDLASGHSLWYATDVAKPLAVVGDLLVAQAERPQGAALDVVLVSTRDGQPQRTVHVSLAAGAWSSVDDGPGRSLSVAANATPDGVVVSWAAEEAPDLGVAPGTLGGASAARAPLAAPRPSGTVRIDLASGRAEPAAADAASLERLARARISEEPRLPQVPGMQYVSADGRHVLASERIADDRVWEKYQWTIYSLADGARVGELRSAFPQAPFFVSGSTLVFESRPFVRRVDGALTREPMKLRAVSLASGAEAWAAPLRDTAFYGPFPESEFLEAMSEDVEMPAARPAGAPRIDVAAFAGTWRAAGPAPKRDGSTTVTPPLGETAGATHVILPHPTDPNVFYAGTVNGGVWKTTNGASARPTWVPLTDGQPSLSIGALDFDPLDTTFQTLVAGVGRFSSFGRRGGARTGLLRTTNGGTTWTALDGGGALRGKNISGVAVRGARIAVSVDRADVTGVQQVGVFRSTDGGATFTQISNATGAATGLPFGITSDLARDPGNASRLFTGVFNTETTGGQNGVYRSTDGGATWTKVSTPAMDALLAPVGANGVSDLNAEFAMGRNNVLFVLLVNGATNRGRLAGLFRSANSGTTWTSMDVPATHGIGQGALHLSEAVDPTNGNIVYVGGDTGLFRCNASLAAGSQCTTLQGSGTAHNSSPHTDSREMAFDAGGNLLESNDGGIYRRTSPRDNTGDWFSISNNIQAFEEHSTDFDPNANIAMGGFQDNGVARELAASGILWQTVNGGDGGDVAVDSISSPGVSSRYSSSQNLGGFRRQVFDANNVMQSQVSPALRLLSGATPTFQFVTPLRINTLDGKRLLIGATNGVYESLDQGESIRPLTPAIPVNGSGGHPLAYGATGNVNVIYVGSGDGVFVRTAAPPAALVQSTAYPGTGSGRSVVDLAIHTGDPNTVFVVDATTVFVTHNAGASWTNITGNLLSLAPGDLRSIAHVKNATGEAVVVGANQGVFAATAASGFQTWGLVGSGFPHATAWDLEYDSVRDVLEAGTLGRGTWLLTHPSFAGTP
jgi:hypothetical protein